MVAYVHAFLRQFHIDSTDTVIQLASYCFDVFVEEVFPVLSKGGKLVIPGRTEIVEIDRLLELMAKYRVTIIDCTPLLLNEFDKLHAGTGCAALAYVHTFISGGDVLKPGYVEHLLKSGKVFNTYGPTEGTVCAAYYHCTGNDVAGDSTSIPIGKPIANYKIYILDEHCKPVPIGVAGELYISGPGVARGYLNRPELTSEKFKRDVIGQSSFVISSSSNLPNDQYPMTNDNFKNLPTDQCPMTNDCFYRTGDLGRWLSDGNIEYLGRVDSQVKIRGYRIELEEIEVQLLRHNAIRETVVLDREGETGEKYLCAYIVSNEALDLTGLREYLLRRLPDYMIPAYFIPVDNIPFTDRGKVDRKTLQSYKTTLGAALEYVAPSSDLEQRIADSWKEVLKLEKVSIYDNFFERGGNSLSIIRLTNRLNNVLGKGLPVVTLFQYPTISALARHLEENQTKINLTPAVNAVKVTKDTADLPIALKENMDIAVIGMAGRFPCAANIDEFWHNLQEGLEGIAFFTDEELLEAGVAQELIHNPNYVKACGILADKDKFDAAFFDYIPAEAKIMDPQVRLFHECAWEAFENAGYITDTYAGPIGVYAGASNSFEWAGKVLFSEVGRSTESFEVAQLVDKDFLATRISYKLNLRGPSISLKSACSTSLVAVHMACRALINRECDMAAGGGVTLLSTGKVGYLYQDGMIMSPDGHCRSFDAQAAGTVGGEGVGIVILKRLKEAEADRDNIYAVVKCSVVNNDGINKVGYTAPGVEGQREVISKALSLAGVAPETVSYVETHGTGTVLGDPIEIKALTLAFATGKRKYCAIGSVKSNVGHLDSAAGVTGFIKTVLALYHRQIPASLHFEKPNPAIDFENSPFYVNTQLRPWKNNGYPLRACVNAFGIGGTNAHIVLEESPGIDESCEECENRVERNYQLILLSAKTSPALTAMRERLANYFKENPLLNPADAAYTLQVGRKAFKHRAALAVSSVEDASDKLKSTDKMQFYILTEENRNIVFMFPGQGAQYVNMAKDLYENEPIFRREMDQCFEILTPLMGYDIKTILYPLNDGEENIKKAREDEEKKEINQTEVSQPVIFIIEYALAKMLMAWEINPDAMIGHSLGEYTAACLSGVFSLPDALQIICLRGKLMQQMPGGAMLGIPLSEKELIPLLAGANHISLAAVNSSSHCVISGTNDAVKAFENQLEKKGRPGRPLHTSHAFHSDMMDPILEEFAREVGRVALNKPNIPFLSNVTGAWITMNDAVDPRYWARHLRQTVRFRDGITQLLNEPSGQTVFIEAGPGKVLSTFVIQHANRKNNTHQVVNLVKSPQEDIADANYLLEKIGQLWLYGVAPDWKAFHSGWKRRRTPLPNYPFQGRAFRLEGTVSQLAAGLMARPQLEKRGNIAEWFYTPVWEQSITPVTPVQESVATSADISPQPHWLVFVDECGLGLTFCKRLEQQGEAVIIGKAGADFVKTGDREFVINPQKESHYQRIFVEFPELKKIHFKILHFWGITGNNVPGLEGTDRFLQMGFYSLLYIARALGDHGINRADMEVITANMHCVTGEEELYPVKSSVVGAVRTIPMEYQGIRCRNIDIVLPSPGSPGESRLLERLLEKINTVFTEQDAIVALRGEFSWIPVIKSVRLEKTGAALPPLIKENGVYLITGGTGGIGFRLAEYLASRVQSRFILTGYSAFPDENQWDHWLRIHEESDRVSYKIRKIREYEQLGSTIKIYSADAADERRMKEVIRDAESKLGYINGVIHAAGLADYAGIIQKRSLEITEKILAPKVKGTMILEEIFKDRELDFLILFSSLASILPSFGQVAYTAANQFLDAYAQSKFVSSRAAKKKGLTISINWDAWQEVGMAVQAAKKTGNTPGQALRSAISVSEGVEAFSRILSYRLPQVVVSTQDLELIIKYGKTAQKEEEDITVADPQDAVPRPEISAAYIAPRDETEQMLARIWEHFFGIEKIGCNDDFSELGGDSLKAVTLVARVQKAMNVQIPLADFFKNPTVAGLAAYIGKASPGQFKPIEVAETREYYGLSSAQKRLYILQQMDPLSISYNVTQIWMLEGKLDRKSLEIAFRKSIGRTESLRTSFEIINEEPVQRIHDEVEFNIEIFGVREPAPGVGDFIRPFELSRAPLLRVGLIMETETRHILLVDIHHIVTDGVSLGLLLREFKVFYAGEELPALRLQYKDYARWQNSPAQKKAMQRQEVYWLEQFRGEIPVLALPIDFPRPARQSFEGASIDFEIPAPELTGLKELTAREGGTLYMVLLSISAIFFAKLANHDDIIMGTPIAGRRHADLENMIGMFVNTLTLRNFPVGEKKFIDFLGEVKERTLTAFENQDFQFEDLVERVLVSRDIARNPLFDVVFMLQNMEAQPGNIPDINIPGLKVKPHENPFPSAKFDITLSCFEGNDGLRFSLEYCTKLFKEETIDRFINYYKNIVSAVLEEPNRKIMDIELLTKAEKRQLLEEFNNTKAPYPNDKTIHDLFEEQTLKTPDSISVLPVQLSYRELNERADRLAGLLIEKGILTDSIVGIMPERTIEMIIGILGILKSGGAYLPIDPGYPQERIDYMLKDSGSKILLTTNEIASCVFNFHHSSFIIHHSSQLAYIIYTSGSTGRPKGVMVEHRNVVRLVKNTDFVEFRETERLLQTGALEFDASTFEIWGSLLNGMSLCTSHKDEILNSGKLKENITKYNISTMWLTSPLFNQLSGVDLEIFKGLKNLLVGGDVLSPLHINRVRERFPHLNIINGYGPTENTTFSTTFKIDKEYSRRIPIGKPITNSTAYVVDKAGHPVPVGVSGELLVGGDGISRGYLNNPELTAEKFLNSHHSSFDLPRTHLSKLYRTGDLARWMADGPPAGGATKVIIEFLGRIDQQVKIRGFRIELEEIESELSKHDQVKEVVVIDRKEENGENSDKYLCAYLVLREACDMAVLKKHLLSRLPDYMVPSYFISVKKIPLTANGKVDRGALPLLPHVPGIENSEIYVAPADQIEEQMAVLWAEILNIEKNKISMNADFFELGGHSLKAMVLSTKIHKIFDVKIPLTDIFQLSTVQELAGYIKTTGAKVREKYTPIEPVEKKEYYVLSSAQKRLYILWQMGPENVVYNIPVLAYLDKTHKEKVEETFKLLIRRHESLRTSFMLMNEEPRQKVHDEVEFGIAYYDLSAFENIEKIIEDFVKPFDLSRAPLLRVGLIHNGEEKYVLMVDMHHIISDGISHEILLKEFMAIYEANALTVLPSLRLQYKDYSEWQYVDIEKGHLMQQEHYWLERLAGELPILNLPYDYSRPEVQSFEGSGKSFSIRGEEAAGLRALAAGQGATIYMVLLMVFDLLMSRLSGLEDIVVGSPVFGRSHADFQSIIGMFVNTLVLRNHVCGEKTVTAFLNGIKTNTLDAFKNRDYPFEALVEKVTAVRDVGRNPVFDVVFALQNMFEPGKEIAPVKSLGYESKIAKFDMTLFAGETVNGLSFSIEYCTRLFKAETIDRFIGYFKNIIYAIIENPSQRINEIEILSEAEKLQLLVKFNGANDLYPGDKTIPQLFQEQVEWAPDRIAVFGSTVEMLRATSLQITYRQLNEQSGRLAGLLTGKGVLADNIIGIMVDRTIETIIGIMGILKSGGAYLPIDPDYPQERIDYMLKDSGAKLLVSTDNLAKEGEKVRTWEGEIIFLEGLLELPQSDSYPLTLLPSYLQSPSNLAYNIYTSGTTGKPKGALIDNKNLVNYVHWFREATGLTGKDRTVLTSSFCFDLGYTVIYPSILSGCQFHIIPKELYMSPGDLLAYIIRHRITFLKMTPSLFGVIAASEEFRRENCGDLRLIVLGGERIKPDDVNRAHEVGPQIKIMNHYGPTETTIGCIAQAIDFGKFGEYKKRPTIGYPIANIKIFILDKTLALTPVGVPGELCVSGAGVGRGYLNRPELTAEKFIDYHHSSFIIHHSKLYRTGDLARWLVDPAAQGAYIIEFMGRIDQQVKIRGFRIEVEEIENNMLRHPGVKEVKVLDKTDNNGDKYLCAYIVSERLITGSEFKEYLSGCLPGYMIPTSFVLLDRIPLTPNGKVDRRALPEPGITPGEGYIAPGNEIEEQIAVIWSEVLGIEKNKLNVNANFFDLGGHSLKMMIMVARIHKVLNLKLELIQVYQAPTIRNIAALIEACHWVNEPDRGIDINRKQESDEIIL